MSDFQESLNTAKRIFRLTEYMAAVEFCLPAPIDEVSLLFHDRQTLKEFVAWAKGKGELEHFNSVPKDLMVCLWADWQEEVYSEAQAPFRHAENFEVRFEFLRIPDTNWRIEAMCVLGGTAPLHEAWLETIGDGCVVHASYKLPSLEAYVAHVPALMGAPLEKRATYVNSYGRFSYYSHEHLAHGFDRWLLKPRVNTRDT